MIAMTKQRAMTRDRSQSTRQGSSVEERQARRAFRSAMSNGLKARFDGVTARSVPDEFMDLLRKADKGSSPA